MKSVGPRISRLAHELADLREHLDARLDRLDERADAAEEVRARVMSTAKKVIGGVIVALLVQLVFDVLELV